MRASLKYSYFSEDSAKLMTENFEKAKAESAMRRQRIGEGGRTSVLTLIAYSASLISEAEAFRDMVHAAGQKESGKTIPKILFSWEE